MTAQRHPKETVAVTAAPEQIDPTDPGHRPDPHPLFHLMRARSPVHRQVSAATGRVSWWLTRYADVQRALSDPDLGRQLDRLPPAIAARHRHWERDPLPMVRRNVFNLDPPDHTRLRRLLAPAFSARAAAALESRVHRIVDELIAALAATAERAGGEVDLIEALALPLPVAVMTELFGLPAGDRPRLRGWSDAMLRSGDPARVRAAGAALVAYLHGKITQRRAYQADDLLSQLVRAEESGDRLNHGELVASVFQLLMAGDETVVNLVGLGVLELLRHPDQLRRLRSQPPLVATAVEEMIRFNGPVGHSRPLYVMADLDLAGATLRRGELVMPVLVAANRDPAVFPRPDLFDIGRSPNRHLGLGHGSHFCLGAALARMEVRAVVSALLRRFPELTLAVDPAALQWRPDLFIRGVLSLPVRLWR